MAFTDIIDTSLPAGNDDPAEADDNMRRIQGGFQELLNVDHLFEKTGTEISDADSGEHRKVTLRTGSAPSAVANKGFVYAKDVSGKAELFYRDEDGNEVQISSGGIIKLTSAALLGILANDTYFTAIDNAGTGTVNLIKATTGDIPEILAGAVLSSSAAPTADAGLANKKYVDDSFSPTTMTGSSGSNGEVTFRNGLQLKWGDKGGFGTGETKVIDFTDEGLTDFDNVCFQGFATYATVNQTESASVTAFTASNISVNNGGANGVTIRWWAIGR